MSARHTQTPWETWPLEDCEDGATVCVLPEYDAEAGDETAEDIAHFYGPNAEANAARVVLCVNAHDELVQVAKDFSEALSELGLSCECGEADCRTTRLRAALAKAGVQP